MFKPRSMEPGSITGDSHHLMTGLLLINLGTPDAPTAGDVRRYLREFLSDPRVIDINPVGRWMLLNLIILPFRPKKSAEAYEKIWDKDRGSPLLFHSQDLVAKVAPRMGPAWHVELGMRYGKPSLDHAMAAFRERGIDRVVVLPLYPQYASSSTGSTLEALQLRTAVQESVTRLSVVDAFYDAKPFIDAFATVSREPLAAANADHVLFSFHGLPERQIRKIDESGQHCLAKSSCCDEITSVNRNCYRAQSYATAHALAAQLGLEKNGYTVAFQSRLGRTPWIKPYTDEVLPDLAAQGKKRLAVFCPAFVADCLETLEEIGMRAKEQFVAAGGEDLHLIPSLNSSDAWADAVVALVADHARGLLPA